MVSTQDLQWHDAGGYSRADWDLKPANLSS
jgi:hypothetical protein